MKMHVSKVFKGSQHIGWKKNIGGRPWFLVYGTSPADEAKAINLAIALEAKWQLSKLAGHSELTQADLEDAKVLVGISPAASRLPVQHDFVADQSMPPAGTAPQRVQSLPASPATSSGPRRWLAARSKAIHHLSRQIAIAWIERNGEFDVGELHYRVGYNSATKCADLRQTGLQLLDGVEGDFTTFLEFLVAQPFKHGSVKRVLDASVYRKLFTSTMTSRLIAGVPERVLVRSRKL